MTTAPMGPRERLEELVSVGTLLTTELSLEGVLERVVEVAARVIGARYAAIGVLSADGRMIENFVTFGMTAAERERIGPPPQGHGILGTVIREARIMRLPDLTKHPDSHGFPAHHPPMHSLLGVPIVGRRGTFGNLYLTEKTGAPEFTDEDERIAMLLAAQTAAAVENARLHEESARLIEEVQHLHRSRERFFAMVNHELRNALAATFGWAEMLVRRKDPATVPRAAFEVFESAEQAVGLINDLLDLSRLDEDRLRPVIREVDPSSVTRRAMGRVTPAAEAKDVTIELKAARDVPTCQTDANRLEQILVNLLGNAIRHTPDRSTIHVGIATRGDRVVFHVQDQGPGIAAPDLERVFDIYGTKADAESRGTGLGLPLSRRLARLLGGELLAESAAGAGARFVLELPAGAA
jgi:signal transduction histidine kinase